MIRHSFHTTLTWFCLLLHLFAGTGMAQGAVVCIAPDGHFAIESPHANSSCVAAQKAPRPVPLNSVLENSAPPTCQDTPIFGLGSHLAIPSSVELAPPAYQPIALLAPPVVAVHRLRLLPAPIAPIALRSTRDSLRSTVLLI